jgi:hypothetical protein
MRFTVAGMAAGVIAALLMTANEAYAFCIWVCDWDCWGWCG